MMRRLSLALVSMFTLMIMGGGLVAALPAPAGAVDVFKQCSGGQVGGSAICKSEGKLFGPGSVWNNILNVVTFLVGAAAVIMIIIGGLRYVLSNGDPTAAASAKNTVLYAVIGLVVAGAANAIVNFVLTNLF